MSVYFRASHGKSWRFDFIFRGCRYTAGGFATRDEAEYAEGQRKSEVLAVHSRIGLSDLRRRQVTERDDQLVEQLDTARALAAARQIPVDESRVGFVYIANAETGLTKIGKAFRPIRRFQALRTHSPAELWLLGVIPTTDALRLEGVLHKDFARFRVRGEWFRLHMKSLLWLCRTRAAFFDQSGRLVMVGGRELGANEQEQASA